jgi:hypothetical protein
MNPFGSERGRTVKPYSSITTTASFGFTRDSFSYHISTVLTRTVTCTKVHVLMIVADTNGRNTIRTLGAELAIAWFRRRRRFVIIRWNDLIVRFHLDNLGFLRTRGVLVVRPAHSCASLKGIKKAHNVNNPNNNLLVNRSPQVGSR